MKHVTLVGVEKLSADELIHSLATVYGLRVAKNEDGSFVLTHQSTNEAQQISDLSHALQSAIPAPIYRAIRARAVSAQDVARGIKRPLALNKYQTQASAIYNAAMQEFLYVAEPQVKAQPSEKLALSHLGEYARSSFEIAQTLDAFSRVCWLADRSIPPYIADFDHIILTGRISQTADGKRFSLFLAYRNPQTGSMTTEVGFGNAIIPF
jgi:hypothetical protein